MHEAQVQLQQEAEALAQRLDVVLHDKFQPRHKGFDSDRPIDKTLNLLQGIVEVRMQSLVAALPVAVLPPLLLCL